MPIQIHRSDWKLLLVLYLSSSLTYYFATFIGYGGFGDYGHPPLWSLEEFCASSGLKFSVFLGVSWLLFCLVGPHLSALLTCRTERRTHWVRRGIGLILLLVGFVLLTHLLQDWLLGLFGWVLFFGGKLAVFNDLFSACFFALQLALLWGLQAHRRYEHLSSRTAGGYAGALETTGNGEGYLLLKSGRDEVAVRQSTVSHVTAYGNYCRVFAGGKGYLLGCGIGSVAEAIPDIQLVRIHRSHAINLNYLGKLVRDGRHRVVVLRDGTQLRVGSTYSKALDDLRILSERYTFTAEKRGGGAESR